jgi:hypothetical protein
MFLIGAYWLSSTIHIYTQKKTKNKKIERNQIEKGKNEFLIRKRTYIKISPTKNKRQRKNTTTKKKNSKRKKKLTSYLLLKVIEVF